MTIFENNDIKLEKFISGSLANNSYLISSKKDGNSIVIDVPDKPMELINKIPRNRLNKSENLENKIDSVSKDLNEIENQLASVTTPINELNRFLGGNVTTGRLGEWNLESIVKEILPDGSYNFQAQINKKLKTE